MKSFQRDQTVKTEHQCSNREREWYSLKALFFSFLHGKEARKAICVFSTANQTDITLLYENINAVCRHRVWWPWLLNRCDYNFLSPKSIRLLNLVNNLYFCNLNLAVKFFCAGILFIINGNYVCKSYSKINSKQESSTPYSRALL